MRGRTIEPHLPAAAVDFEGDAALRRGLLKRRLSLEIIYVHVPWLIHPRTGVGWDEVAEPVGGPSQATLVRTGTADWNAIDLATDGPP